MGTGGFVLLDIIENFAFLVNNNLHLVSSIKFLEGEFQRKGFFGNLIQGIV